MVENTPDRHKKSHAKQFCLSEALNIVGKDKEKINAKNESSVFIVEKKKTCFRSRFFFPLHILFRVIFFL